MLRYWAILTDLLVLMSIPIASLGKSLVAERARKWAGTEVCAHMVHHVTQLGEILAAGQALQHLILPSSLVVKGLHFFKALSLPDGSHVVLFSNFVSWLAIAIWSIHGKMLTVFFESKDTLCFRSVLGFNRTDLELV